jgi:acetolactate synthase small subunit
MNEGLLLARVSDRPGALERAVGLIRRRAFAVRRLSISLAHDAALELLLRIDETHTSRERVRQELLGLHDVLEVRDLGAAPRLTRELLLAWIKPTAAPQAPGAARVVAVSAEGGCLLELAGTPAEIDDVLARLREHGTVFASVRSGEMAAPEHHPAHDNKGES